MPWLPWVFRGGTLNGIHVLLFSPHYSFQPIFHTSPFKLRPSPTTIDMAPRRRLEDEEDIDRSAEYYRNERDSYDKAKAAKRKYGESCDYLQKMIQQQWER
jgi:hypothetical protein